MTYAEFQKRFEYDPDTDQLGEGGFAKVYKAWDTTRNEFAALKIAPVVAGQETFSLSQEFDRVKNLAHSNVTIYMDCYRLAFPTTGKHDVALMKYYETGNLAELLNRQTLTTSQKEELIKGILEGITFLHHQKPFIVHRDLKPANILIATRRGDRFIPLLTDFGISRRANANYSYVTNKLKAVSGQFTAPEQFEEDAVRPNADLWSFGVLVAYIWLNGKMPFRQDKLNLDTYSGQEALRQRIQSLQFVDEVDRIPSPYRELIRRCLIIDPAHRAKNTEELHEILSEKTIIRDPPGLQTPPPPPPPKRPVAWTIAGLLVSIAGLIGWLWFRSNEVQTVVDKPGVASIDTVKNKVEPLKATRESTPKDKNYLVIKKPQSTSLPDIQTKSFSVAKPSAEDLYREGKKLYDLKKYATALPLLRESANIGNANAQYQLGLIYYFGEDYYDLEQALKWFRKAAQKDILMAQVMLGSIYDDGLAGKNLLEAESGAQYWFRKALPGLLSNANRGDSLAQSILGGMYENGTGVTENDKQAIYWYRKAAEKNQIMALNDLGRIYEYGILGVSKDIPQAIKWYQKAARLGNAAAKDKIKEISKE